MSRFVLLAVQSLERFLPTRGEVHVVFRDRQRLGEQFPDACLVVHDEDARTAIGRGTGRGHDGAARAVTGPRSGGALPASLTPAPATM